MIRLKHYIGWSSAAIKASESIPLEYLESESLGNAHFDGCCLAQRISAMRRASFLGSLRFDFLPPMAPCSAKYSRASLGNSLIGQIFSMQKPLPQVESLAVQHHHWIPTQALEDDLSDRAFRLLSFLYAHSGGPRGDKCVRVGYADMVRGIGASRSKVASALAELRKADWFFHVKVGGSRKSVYMLRVPPRMLDMGWVSASENIHSIG